MKLFEFEVRGESSFPIDMLRYDACWPIDSEGVSNMLEVVNHPRTITLRSHRAPTPDRWASFQWEIALSHTIIV